MSELFKFYPFIGDVYRWSVFANRLHNTIIHFFPGARMLNAAQVSSGYQPCVKIQEPTSSQPWSCSCFVLKCTCDIHLRGGVCVGSVEWLVCSGRFWRIYVQTSTEQEHSTAQSYWCDTDGIHTGGPDESVCDFKNYTSRPQWNSSSLLLLSASSRRGLCGVRGKGILDSAPRKLPDIIFMKGFKVVLIIRHR